MMSIVKHILSLLRRGAIGGRLNHAIERNEHAMAELDAICREVLQK